MGITNLEIEIPVMTIKVAALNGEESDGVPATWAAEATDSRWEILRRRLVANGGISTCTLRRILGTKGVQAVEEPEDAGTLHGNRFRVIDGDDDEWFAGYSAQDSMIIQADPQHEDVQITIYGPEWRLNQKVVSGQWHINQDKEDKILDATYVAGDFVRAETHTSDIPCIFNPMRRDKDGIRRPVGNMFDIRFTWTLATAGSSADRGCSVFDDPGRKVLENYEVLPVIEAAPWTIAKALRSLVEFWDNGTTLNISAAEWDAIETTLGSTAIEDEVNVEGMTLLQAMTAVLKDSGFGFSIEPYSQDNAGSFLHRLHVENLRDAGTTITIAMGEKGVGVSSPYATSELHRLDFMRDGQNIRNEVTVIGSMTRVQIQAKFLSPFNLSLLHPAWSTTDYDLATWATNDIVDLLSTTVSEADWRIFANQFHLTGVDHATYIHTFRSFALNEDGQFSYMIYDGNAVIPDLAAEWNIGNGTDCLRRARPIGPQLVWQDENLNRYRRAVVELVVAVGSDEYIVDITNVTDIWRDAAGFTIRGGSAGDLFQKSDQGIISKPWFPFAGYVKESTIPAALRKTSYLTLLHNTLRESGTYKLELRIGGTIEDDTAVQSTSAKQAAQAMPLLSKRVVRNRQYRKVRTENELPGTEDTRDNTDLCKRDALVYRDTGEDEMGIGSITIPFSTRTLGGETLRPLIGVTGTTGRVIDFDVDGGNDAYFPLIRQVVNTFGEGQITELTLDSNLLGVS